MSEPQVEVASRVVGSGFCVPERIVTNEHFASYLDTNDEWIQSRTGIVERRWADPDTSASQLAEPACRDAIESAGLTPADIDGIIVATVTPDNTFPSTACYLQRRLGCPAGVAFDVNAVCSGFVYALTTADSLIRSGIARNFLVVGVDIYSRILDMNDRRTCILFGDGAGAVVLSSVSKKGGALTETGSAYSLRGMYGAQLGADGSHTDILCVPSGTASPVTAESLAAGSHYLRMDGREVFKLAVRKLAEISQTMVSEIGLTSEDVDYVASHQANQRILLSMAKSAGIAEEKVLSNVSRYGNTSAASVPILLAEFAQLGTIKQGDLLLVSAFGGGVTWGAVLLRW